MDGWLLRYQSIQGRSQVQPVDHVVDRTVADEVRTPGWESDGSDRIAAQQAELTTDQPWRSQVLTGPGGSREPAPVPRGL
jgi:hypothetical protein